MTVYNVRITMKPIEVEIDTDDYEEVFDNLDLESFTSVAEDILEFEPSFFGLNEPDFKLHVTIKDFDLGDAA